MTTEPRISVVIGTFGLPRWRDLARSRAAPTADGQVGVLETIVQYSEAGTLAQARNDGAAAASGDWLLFLDADDELAPGYVAAMERAMTYAGYNPNVVPTLFTPAVSHKRLRPGRPVRGTFYREKPLSDNNWLVIGTLISRELFWHVGGFDEQDPHGLEDWSLWTRAAAAGATVVKVPDAVYVAHTRRNSSHAVYARNPEYGVEYTRIRRAAWPELYE